MLHNFPSQYAGLLNGGVTYGALDLKSSILQYYSVPRNPVCNKESMSLFFSLYLCPVLLQLIISWGQVRLYTSGPYGLLFYFITEFCSWHFWFKIQAGPSVTPLDEASNVQRHCLQDQTDQTPDSPHSPHVQGYIERRLGIYLAHRVKSNKTKGIIVRF